MSAYQILESIRLALTDKLMRAPLGTVLSKTAGGLKSIFVDRVETIELPLGHLIPEGISNLLLPVCVFIYMISIDRRIALASLACIPPGALVYAIMMRNYNSQYARFMESSRHVNSVIVEYVEGIQVIKAFNQSSSSYEKFTRAVGDFKDFTLDWFRSTWGVMNLGNAILPSTLLGILPVGMLLYIYGALTPAELTLCMILSMSIVGSVSWFTTAVNDFKSIQYAINDVNQLMELPELPEEKENICPEHYTVALEDVSFAYNDRDGDVLRNISLHLPQGSFTALVGPSGGGKSTVARLIARFWDVRDGSISIGGVDIRKIPLSQLADTVSFVTQDNFLFNCSLLENIRLGKPSATDEEVFEAARAAQCEHFISHLEKGRDTTAGEAGGKLSGGERQRIAIARAILKDAPIIILDEATASVDPENEHFIQEAISSLTNGKTIIVIAHRLATIEHADQILVVDNGRIAQRGTHAQLILEKGIYRQFVDIREAAEGWRIA
ncbi:MAG: putative ABC transporter ATP-binding protein [Eubacterium sp.]